MCSSRRQRGQPRSRGASRGASPGFPAVRAGPGRAQAGRPVPPARPAAASPGARRRGRAQALGRRPARAARPRPQPQAAVWLRQAGPRRAEELGRRVVLARGRPRRPCPPPRQGGGTGSGLRPHWHPRRRAQGKPGTTGFGQLRQPRPVQARPPADPQRRRLRTLLSSPRATPRVYVRCSSASARAPHARTRSLRLPRRLEGPQPPPLLEQVLSSPPGAQLRALSATLSPRPGQDHHRRLWLKRTDKYQGCKIVT